MDISKLTIKDIGELYNRGDNLPELIEACRLDKRTVCQRFVRSYQRQLDELERLEQMLTYEKMAYDKGYELVAGVDEAGRGPLAGPVSIAAVILPKGLKIPRLNDSKKLSPKVRDELYDEILDKALTVEHAFVDEKTIDTINILQATMDGMYQVLSQLEPKPQAVLIDAVKLPKLSVPSLSLIKGDAKSLSIAAASVIAKVSRDRLMDELDKKYPEYGFAEHKGYGTKSHIDAIKKYGPCPIHRRTFEPIKSILLNS